MTPQALIIWDALELRTPTMLRIIGEVSDAQFHWWPPGSSNSIAWLLWHIAEVEDNWVRDRLEGLAKRYPFGKSVRDAAPAEYPSRAELLAYFGEVRELTRQRLDRIGDADWDRPIDDPTFGRVTARQVWGGVATSCAWHGGQIALTRRLAGAPAGPKVHASFALLDGDRVLLVREAKAASRGLWNLPGGHVEPGEPPADAAARELREETTVLARPEALVGVYTGPASVCFVFAAAYAGQPVAAGDEIMECRWATLAEVRGWPDVTLVGPAMRRMILADLESGRRSGLDAFATVRPHPAS